MGGLVFETASQISKFVMISMKTCYKSVGDHPFVVGILLLFIFLQRSFPVLFSVLVSTSPVIICTAVLLGTLLSFGQSNIPEIERQDDIASLRTWVPGDDTVVVGSGGSFSAENFSASSRDIVYDDVAPDSTDYRVNGEVGDHDVYAPLINENVQHTQSDERVTEDVDRDIELETRGLPNDVEAVEPQYTLLQRVRDQILQVQDDNVSAGGGEHLDSFLGGYGHDESGEASDSGSDGAESSSPDASMADILPILDELHPLLDSDAPQQAHMSHDGSDAASDSSVESDEDIEDQGGQVDEGDGVDYNGGDEKEVPAHSGTEDESKSAIKWTDDDQKNLMDLGNLELERNQRLENLIARRRARKSFKLMPEKNLIDFDGVDLPFNVSPISTTRRNPFNSPFDDSYGNMGLPPIPGSAPSIMLARRNPFDLPYDSNEEKPDLKGDLFEQEFIALHANNAFFRRHESFSLGASSLGGAKHERQDFKWKPIFLPEILASEGPGYSLFQRQSSEVSESKLSSVPDSDLVSSVPDLDDRKFSEQDFTTETEVISNIYHASDLVDHGSHSYEDIYSLEMGQADRQDVIIDQRDIELGEREKLEPSLLVNGGLPTLVSNKLHLSREIVEEEDSSSSSSSLSSLSEADEKISDVRKGDLSSEPSGDLMKEEPVYDSIPLEAENLISLNSISSDLQAEISELVTLQASAEMHVPFVYKNNDVDSENIEKATSGDEEIFGATSKAHGADEIEGDLGIYNQPQLTCSLSEVETSEQEKDLSLLDKSMVEPCLDNHLEALLIEDNVKEEIDDIKEIDAELLLELDTVGDFSVKEVVGEPLDYELIREESNAVSTESGLSTADSNLSKLNSELPIFEHSHKGVDIDVALKQIHEGVDVEEGMFPSVVDIEQVSEDTMQTSSPLLTVEATNLEDIITSNQPPRSSVKDFPQLSDSEGLAELHLELPPEGNEVSTDVLHDAVGDIASDNIGFTVQDTFTTHNTLKQLSESNVTELPNPSNSKDILANVGTEAVVESVLSNVVYGVDETTTNSPLKQVSEDAVWELPKPSNLKDGCEEVTTTVVDSIEEIGLNNTGSVVQETIPTHSALKQVSENVAAETIEIALGNREVVQEPVPTQVSEKNVGVGELPKPSKSNDGLTE
ncbi:hypothetical protein ACLB2K_007088 [Fragaria x ananassa]